MNTLCKTTVLVLYALLLCACRKQAVYTYDISDFKKVPESLICYRESKQVRLDFSHCGGLAVSDGRWYVTGDERLLIYDSDGVLIKSVTLPTAAKCLALSKAGALYLGMTNYISVYDTDGNETDTWAQLDERALITSLAVSDNIVYAADANNHSVACYSLSGKLLNFLDGKTSVAATGFIIPSPYFDLAAAADNTLWVVNPGHRRIEHYSAANDFLSSWGSSGFQLSDFSGCCNPVHIAVLPDNRILTAEKGIVKVKVYDTVGKMLCVAAAPALFKSNTIIADLAVNAAGLIFIMDPAIPAIRIFSGVQPEQGGKI